MFLSFNPALTNTGGSNSLTASSYYVGGNQGSGLSQNAINTTSFSPTASAAATAVPFDFNPTEGAALGIPLFVGLGMLRKKKLAQKSAAKRVAELVS